MRKWIISIILLFVPVALWSQDYYDDEELEHWDFSAIMGFNNDGYDFELGLTWWPVENFGFRCALGLTSSYDNLIDNILNEYDDYYYYDSDSPVRFKFMPSIMLKSPVLIRLSDTSAIKLFANPGVILSPGASGSKDAQWFNWQIRGGVHFDFSDFYIQLGYGYSNFYLYSGDPYTPNDHEYKRISNTHTGFLSFGLTF